MTTAAARPDRRVVPLRKALRRSAKPRVKAPSFPTANQIEQVTSQLRALVETGEAQKVDSELKQLLIALGLDPANPDAWRDAVLLLGALHHGVGKPRRTNRNAEKLSNDDSLILFREIIILMRQGLSREQAVNALAGDESKARLLKLKTTRGVIP